MKRSIFLALVAILAGVYGLGFLAVPAPLMALYGPNVNVDGILFAKLFGISLLAQAVIFWNCRNVTDPLAINGILWSGVVYNILEVVVMLKAIRAGTVNSMGWSVVALGVLIGVGFASYLSGKKPSPQNS